MTRVIPIENVYYLLAYAWDLFVESSELPVDADDCPDVHNLLAAVLGNGVRRLATKGMDKGYTLQTEVTPRLRGRIDWMASYRKLTHLSKRLHCEFDELTADTQPNRIVKSTIRLLLVPSSPLTKRNRKQLRVALGLLDGISDLRLTRSVFARVQLHRNNRHYRLLLNVCRLIFECFLPEERGGGKRFRGLLDNERLMNRIFEKFVRNFARRHCRDAKVDARPFHWVGEWETEFAAMLPMMKTDVTLERRHRKTILDCKYYKQSLVLSHGKVKIHSSHLYQLNAYLQNAACTTGWEEVDGILLYPTVKGNDIFAEYRLLGHRVRVVSINLDQHWTQIEQDLRSTLS